MAEKKTKEQEPAVVEAKRCANCGDPKGPTEDICDVCGSMEFIGPEDERYAAAKAACQQRLDGPVSPVPVEDQAPNAGGPSVIVKPQPMTVRGMLDKKAVPAAEEGGEETSEEIGDEPNPPAETAKERKAREKAEAAAAEKADAAEAENEGNEAETEE